MGVVVSSHSMSLDGFIAQPDGKPGPLHEWLFTGDQPSRHAEGVERAVELAKAAAGEKDVSVMGGDIVRQCLAAGLLDELDIDLVPVLLGEGVRLFDDSVGSVELGLEQVVDAPGVTHFGYRVVK